MTSFSLSPAYCAENHIIILRISEHTVTVGYTEQSTPESRSRVQKAFNARKRIGEDGVKQELVFELIDEEEFKRNLTKLYAEPVGFFGKNADIPEKESHESEAPIINLLDSLLLECLSRRGTDIHIECDLHDAIIRLRIDGELSEYSRISFDTASALISRIKLLSELEIVEKRRAQDGQFEFSANGRNVEVRVSTIPVWNGESAVLRLLDTSVTPLALEDLGFCDAHLKQLHEICGLRNSLILVSGPTGAGKTTTLAALLSIIRDEKTKIVTIEDPVEYRLEGITQIPVKTGIGMDFDDILRRVFRHDPDVIMIGEIRDEKTARTAVRAALTGHLVFATVHATDAPSTLLRLLDMHVEPYLLASVFGAAVSQRLVKRKSGKGRRVACEILMSDNHVVEAIRSKASLTEIEDCMKRQGAIQLEEDMRREL